MTPRRSIVGLEIDPGSISAAEVATTSGLAITRGRSVPLPSGAFRDGEINDVAAVTDAIKQLWKLEKGLGKRVRVGVANQRIVMRWVELPVITDRKQLDTAVRFAAQDAIPMRLDTAVLDWQDGGIVDTDAGPRQRVMVVAARRDMIDRIVEAVTGAGLRVEGIDLSAFAMMRAIGHRDSEPTLFLSIGGMTNLAVAQDGHCVFTRVSGGGTEAVAVEVAESLTLTLDHARAWLTHVGLQAPLDTLEGDAEIIAYTRQALQSGVRRIAAEVRNSLDYHQMQASTGISPVTTIALTGAATEIDGFSDALSAELAMPVEQREVPFDRGRLRVVPGGVSVAAGLAVTEVAA